MSIDLVIRRDTAAGWTASNPVLATTQEGIETDTGQWKKGDGTTAWVSLPYAVAFNLKNLESVDAVSISTAISTERATNATSYVRAGVTGLFIDVTTAPYRATGDGTTNDTAAIQAAIDVAYAAGGGTVFFPRGTYSATRITLKSRVTLLGANWLSSTIKHRTGTNADFIVLANVNTEQVSIRDMRINGNRAGNSSGNTVVITNTAGTYTFSDPYHLFQNVFVENSAGDAWNITSGCRESRFLNCHAKLAYAHGFYVAGTDNFFTDCTAATSGQSGWFISDGNNQFISCKSFSNGTRCTSYGLEGEGFYVQNAARNKFVGCEAQDNERAGFIFIGASTKHNSIIGCIADSNAAGTFLSPPQSSTSVGLILDACIENVIKGFVCGNQRSTQDVGVQIKNAAARNTVEATVRAQASSFISWTLADYSSNDVVINGNERSKKIVSTSSNYTPDPHEAGTHLITLGASITVNDTVFANKYIGARLRFILRQDATGGRVVSWNAIYLLPSWTPNTAANKVNVIDFIYDGTNWLCVGATVAA